MCPSTPIPPMPEMVGSPSLARDSLEPVRTSRVEGLWSDPRLMISLVLLGVALRVWAYAAGTALYLDEVLLSRSILDLPLRELLTKPLPFDQVAPRGFLLVERLAVIAFGRNELALRIFPFLCAISSVILFRRVAQRAMTGAAPAVALFLFAIGVPFIRFGSDVKQYEVDVAVAILLLLLMVEVLQRNASAKRLLWLGLVGFVVIWFSQASVLVMAGLGLGLAIEWAISRQARTARVLLLTIPIWAAASVAGLLAGFRSMTPATRDFMHDFWAAGFFPLPLRSLADLRWFWNSWTSLFEEATLLRYRWPATFVLIAIVGIVSLWKRSRLVALFLLGPFVLCMAAAVAQQYPFRGRLVVWLLPSLLLAVAAGAEWIRQRSRLLHAAFGGAVVVAILLPPALALVEAPPPYEIEHHRDLLHYLQQHRRPGDAVYVLPVQQVGTGFYGPRYGLLPGEWTTGVCDQNGLRSYIKDVDRYRGISRLWVLSGSGRPLRPLHAFVLSYLSTIGVKRDTLSFPSLTLGAVRIELFDLSDPVRLKSASAETFPAPPMSAVPRPHCREWTRPGFDFNVSNRSSPPPR